MAGRGRRVATSARRAANARHKHTSPHERQSCGHRRCKQPHAGLATTQPPNPLRRDTARLARSKPFQCGELGARRTAKSRNGRRASATDPRAHCTPRKRHDRDAPTPRHATISILGFDWPGDCRAQPLKCYHILQPNGAPTFVTCAPHTLAPPLSRQARGTGLHHLFCGHTPAHPAQITRAYEVKRERGGVAETFGGLVDTWTRRRVDAHARRHDDTRLADNCAGTYRGATIDAGTPTRMLLRCAPLQCREVLKKSRGYESRTLSPAAMVTRCRTERPRSTEHACGGQKETCRRACVRAAHTCPTLPWRRDSVHWPYTFRRMLRSRSCSEYCIASPTIGTRTGDHCRNCRSLPWLPVVAPCEYGLWQPANVVCTRQPRCALEA